MTPSRRPQDDLPRPPGRKRALVLALSIHAGLAAALIFGVSWQTKAPGPVQVELWAALPAPTAAPEPPPPPPPPPAPAPRPAPTPPPAVQNADIALEKAREEKRQQEEQARREAQRREQERRQAEERAAREREQQARREAERREQERRQAEERRRAEERQKAEDQKLREAFRSTATAAAGIETGRADGTALRNQVGGAGGTDAYAAAIRSCIRAGVVYSPSQSDTDNPVVEFALPMLPTGEPAGPPRLIKSSGNAAFDRAVENGIRRCDPFPRPPAGQRVQNPIPIIYRMFDR